MADISVANAELLGLWLQLLMTAVMVYRTFIVWNQNLLVITIPFMLFLSSIAAVYCLYLLVLIITDSVGTNIFFTFFDISPPLVALVFSVLIVGAQKTHKSGSSLSGTLSGIRFGGQSSRGQQRSSIPGVEVRLEHIIRSETDGHPAVDALETIGTYDSENKGESLVHVV
ncbi:hypothetical protein DICSQDRAFT_129265 [Dichomitus squalens LYAD-421 SS1]|uniref:Transmembrane protein n=1 Tax=Dichomitus squalens (strain LYAD-421) TaxID=732165 RepID=R7SPZ6_DICSQ|nr:uncharacterized protein DICSQDRAFT_129265 [Dichomitus squalens LYAD-421 SS1]EJF57815.1 hypothetical protein DICSQDRAFT_129265 [Dichomitus squalens LYAD-421 SS1]